MNALERAGELVEEITGYLAAENIDGATITMDGLAIPAALANGPVIAIQPPKLKYPTYHLTEATWELFIVAGPPADKLAAWAAMEPIITALREPLSIDDAEPATFDHPSMAPHAAYVLTFTETI